MKQGDTIRTKWKHDGQCYTAVITEVITNPVYVLLGRKYRIRFVEGEAKDDEVYISEEEVNNCD